MRVCQDKVAYPAPLNIIEGPLMEGEFLLITTTRARAHAYLAARAAKSRGQAQLRLMQLCRKHQHLGDRLI